MSNKPKRGIKSNGRKSSQKRKVREMDPNVADYSAVQQLTAKYR